MSLTPLGVYDGGVVNYAAPVLHAAPATTYRAAAATTLDPTMPASTPDGALLYMMTSVYSLTDTVATPAGWTLLASGPQDGSTDGDLRCYLWTKIASGEGSTTSLTKTGTAGSTITGIVAYTGAAHAAVSTGSKVSAGNATVNVPSVTTVLPNSMLLIICGHRGALVSVSGVASGYTEQVDTASLNPPQVQMADKVLATAGASGATTETISNASQNWHVYHCAISPTVTV